MMLWWRIARWAVALVGGVAAPAGVGPVAARFEVGPVPPAVPAPPRAVETVWVGAEGPVELRLARNRRLAVQGGRVTFAAEAPMQALRGAAPLGQGRWVFVSDDAVWGSDSFLGPLRVVAQTPAPWELVAARGGRIVLRSPSGDLQRVRHDGSLEPVPLPPDTFDVAFADGDFGLAITQGGFVWRTQDTGGHWVPVDLQARGPWRLFARTRSVRVMLLGDAEVVVDGEGTIHASHHGVVTDEVPEPSAAQQTPNASSHAELDPPLLEPLPPAETVSAVGAPAVHVALAPDIVTATPATLPFLLPWPMREIDRRGPFEAAWTRSGGYVGNAAQSRASVVRRAGQSLWRVLATRTNADVIEEVLLRQGMPGAPSRRVFYGWRTSGQGQVLHERVWVGDGDSFEVGLATLRTHGVGVLVQRIAGTEPAWFFPVQGEIRRVPAFRVAGTTLAQMLCAPTVQPATLDRVWIPEPRTVAATFEDHRGPIAVTAQAVEIGRSASDGCVLSLAANAGMQDVPRGGLEEGGARPLGRLLVWRDAGVWQGIFASPSNYRLQGLAL